MQLDPTVALVVLSGGQDSTTCLFWAKKHFKTVHAITFDYDQRHRAELTAAYRVGKLAGVASHEFLTLGPVLKGTSPLTNRSETLEQYKDSASLPGGLEKTFVPGRNILFLSLAANRAYCLGAQTIVTGICEEDSGGYPDCTELFRARMESALSYGLDSSLTIAAPLMYLTKAKTVILAREGIDDTGDCWNALAFSHTSYDGAYPPTGKDHATLLRAKGFVEADMPDPLVLRAVAEGLMELPLSKNYRPEARNKDFYDAHKIETALRIFNRQDNMDALTHLDGDGEAYAI